MGLINASNCPYFEKMDSAFISLVNEYLSVIPGLPLFVITSSWRSPQSNSNVGGIANSFHLVGRAIDLQFDRIFYMPQVDSLDVIWEPALNFQGIWHIEPSPRGLAMLGIGSDSSPGSVQIGWESESSSGSVDLLLVGGVFVGIVIGIPLLLLLLKRNF